LVDVGAGPEGEAVEVGDVLGVGGPGGVVTAGVGVEWGEAGGGADGFAEECGHRRRSRGRGGRGRGCRRVEEENLID